MQQRIILDCDPGIDDALAILLAIASPEIDILGITVSFGNVGLAQTASNAQSIRELSGAHVPIYAGADRPLLRDRIHAENYHGESGLGDAELPIPRVPIETQHAVNFIIDTILGDPGNITLVATGAMTNLALAFRMEPRIMPAVKRIVFMGGSTKEGNTTPAAEFNILADPHAAKIVMHSGVPLTMIGLNVTQQVLATPERVNRFRTLRKDMGQAVVTFLEFYAQAHLRIYGWNGSTLHDPCTIAYLITPTLFSTQSMFVDVDVNEGINIGRTVCDLWGVTGQRPNVDVAVAVDTEGVFDLLTDRLSRL